MNNKMFQYLKAASVGIGGSLVMFILMVIGIKVTGIAPFDIPPSAAFLEKLGLHVGPLPLIVHFGYGAFWSMVFYALFQDEMSFYWGIMLALGLWLFMMIVYSPIIGWGFFGFGGADYAESSKLYLEPGPKYLIATLVLHLIYGSILGFFNPLWIDTSEPATRENTSSQNVSV